MTARTAGRVSQAPGLNTGDTDAVVAYRTTHGVMFRGAAEHVLVSNEVADYRGAVQLILTSPPFPLNKKKKYGNRVGEKYVHWLSDFAQVFRDMLVPDGSIVIELGNAWEPGKPTMSTLPLRALLSFLRKGGLNLCQQFIFHNPAKLPTPAQWVNIDRIRVKDSFTHLWWMSPRDRPKANNRRVLTGYSLAMQRLLGTRKYNAGRRPSEHNIGAESFLRDNGGAIPSNVLCVANTKASDPYQRYCRAHDLEPHPARMPIEVAEFFVRFLTEEGDIVLDPFAGSNTTGAAAERLGRRWLAIEAVDSYVDGSRGRFACLSGLGAGSDDVR